MSIHRLKLAGFLVSVATILSVAGCGGQAAPTTAPAPAPAKATEPAKAAAPATAAPAAKATAPAKAETGEPYKIGAIFDVTGGAASLGKPEADTVKMIEDDLKAKGGIKGPDGKMHPVQFVVYDSKSTETETVLAAKKLIEEDKVPVIIGPTQSGTTLAIVDAVQQAQVPLISAAASFKIVEPVSDRKWVFKTPQSDSLMMTALLNDVKAKGYKKVAFMSVNNAYGDSGKAEYDKLAPGAGVETVASEKFGADDKDMSAQITKIKGTDAQALVIWAIPPAASIVTKNAVDLGVKIPIYHSHGIGNKDFIDLAGPAANGIRFPVGKLLVAESLPDNDVQKPVLLKYAKDYETKFGAGTRSTFGGHAWDAAYISLQVLEKVGPDRSKIRDELEKVKDFVGITGVFTFSPRDHNGLDTRAAALVEIKDGKWTVAK